MFYNRVRGAAELRNLDRLTSFDWTASLVHRDHMRQKRRIVQRNCSQMRNYVVMESQRSHSM